MVVQCQGSLASCFAARCRFSMKLVFSPEIPMRYALTVCALTCIAAGVMGCGASTKAPAITVTIAPTSADVSVNKTQQFTATVSGTTNTAVTWSVAGGATNGSISPTGLYNAPTTVPSPAQVTITAASQASTSQSASGSAVVTVTAASNVAVSVSPESASVGDFETQQFTAN